MFSGTMKPRHIYFDIMQGVMSEDLRRKNLINITQKKKKKKKTVKQGSGKIIVWGCFPWDRVDPIYLLSETMTKEVYQSMLEEIMLTFANE